MASKIKDLELAFRVAEEGAKAARKAKVKPTVKEAERVAYPGIYDDPRVIAEKAASRVAPESPAMKQLFGVTRDDLYEMSKGRKGNIEGKLPGVAENPKGSKAAEKVMTKKNEQRLLDALYESEKYPELIKGMDPWYTMDPLYKQMVQLVGPKKAAEEYKKFNTLLGMASPGSEVTTEIPRGTAAYFLQKERRFPEFEKYLGVPSAKRLEMEEFPKDILNVPGHMYHKTAHSTPMAKFLETGELGMNSPKVPMYIEASGVPETGFQTDIPVGDAHWSRAVGLGDTRTAKNFGASVSTPEMSMLAPWWRNKIAGEVGIESVPAQARTWGLFSPQTGVTTPIGKPKLEMIADKIMETAIRLNISPEDARDLVLMGKTYAGKAGGGAIKGLQKAIKAGEKAVKEIKHTIPEAEQPFIGYIKKSGDHESYSHDAAKAVDYHHSHLMKDPDAMFADDALTFVRYQGEPIFTIKGESALDPYHPDSAKHISTLAELLKRNGADPNTPLRIEDLALPREEAPYQGKQIGTLQDWIDMPKNKYGAGGLAKAAKKAIEAGIKATESIPAYHGTGEVINKFKPNTFFATDPKAASSYAIDRGYGGGANVIPVNLTPKNLATSEHVEDIAKKLGIYEDDRHLYEYISPNVNKNANKVINELKKQNFEGVKFPDWDMDNNEIESILIFDPQHIKNKYGAGGSVKALDKALKVGERAAKETLKKAKDYKPTKGKISEVKDYIRDTKGEYGAQRVERAADLVPNLEKQYSVRALREAFDGDNAKSVMVMNPADYEKYARQLPEHYGKSISGIQFKEGKQVPITIPPEKLYYDILTGKDPLDRSDYTAKKMMLDEYLDYLGKTAREEGLLETPYLMLDESLNLPNYRIAGHEGRHRSRALAKLGDESTLIRLLPRGIREGLPRRSQEEYQQGLQELLGPNPKVYPEHTMVERKEPQGFYNSLQDKIQRPLIELPEFFAEGGRTQGKPIKYEEEYPRSTKSDVELLDEFNKDELTARDYFKATPTIAKTAGKMLKEQAKEELPTYLEPRAIPDIALNALATGIGSISDLAHLGTGVERPVLGSEQLMDLLSEYGITSGTKRPLAENLLAVASPKVLRTAEQGLNKLVPIAKRSFTPLTTTVEAVAPDLAKFRPRDFQEYVTNRLISNQYGGTPMNFMGDEITKKLPAQGVYFNEAGELETNPMMAIDIPNIKDVSKAKALRADIASAGKALNQESMAGIRFLPLATNKLEDATAILVKPKSGKISNEDVIKLGNEFGNSMVVSHNPRLGGVVLAPFDKPSGELQSAQSKIKDLFGSDMNIKAGHSDLQKDRFYMPKSDYQKEGARKVPKSTKAVREELKKAESLRYRKPSFLSDTNPLSGGISD